MEIKKPPFGQPCNGCGVCCKISLCPLAVFLFGHENGPCPALEKTEPGRYACGLVRSPHKYVSPYIAGMGNAAAILIGAGDGCDAIGEEDTNQEQNEEIRRKWAESVPERRPAVNAAKRMWGAL